ncbi:hypothetical protein [Pyrofollis japonicus]|uniref:hypothetical protein n=1 Tax=Pyrofollis japonicus TaxID=3060460 RepID=UPI00295BF8D3|nr:hypothetical protein [Pyrofollis japonicus]
MHFFVSRGVRVLGRLTAFLRERASEIVVAVDELFSLRRSLVSSLVGRDLSELVRNEYYAEMLLGGLRPEEWRRPRYPLGSLAGFYHEVLGIGVDNLKLLLARLSDGLPLTLATRGIRVVEEETEPLQLIGAIRGYAAEIAKRLGAEGEAARQEGSGPATEEPSGENHVALELFGSLLDALLKTIPPYSEEATLLYAASVSLPVDAVDGDVLEELRGLGAEEKTRLPGCPERRDRCLLGAVSGSVLEHYYCLARAATRLIQDKRIRAYYELPSPLRDILEKLPPETLTDQLLVDTAQYARKTPCLPKEPCKEPPPCLPTGYAVAEIELPLHDVIVELPGGREAVLAEILEPLRPQLCSGLARAALAGTRLQLTYIVKAANPT